MPPPPTVAPPASTVVPNPKSILSDRNHNAPEKINDTNPSSNSSSPRVTFAKVVPLRTPSRGSTPTKTSSPVREAQAAKQKKAETETSTSEINDVDKSVQTPHRKVKKSKSKSLKITSVETPQPGEEFLRKKSDESVGHASKRSTGTRRSVKLKKHVRNPAKVVPRTSHGTPKRSRSGRKLKKKAKSTSLEVTSDTHKAKDNDVENAFKPAKLDAEYAAELNKITQILRAVSVFDASTAAGAGRVASPRSKVTTAVGETRDNVRRPLSGDELKQLLSSITRVVSLHQLPINVPNQSTEASHSSGPYSPPKSPQLASDGYKVTGATEKQDLARHSLESEVRGSATTSEHSRRGLRRKSKRAKDSIFGSGAGKDFKKTRSRLSNKSKDSKVYLRKSRSRNTSEERGPHPGRPYSEGGSSVSSTEKDPVQNAAFLRKYFEESTRLANKEDSSDDLDDDGEEKRPKKKKSKKKKGSLKKDSLKSVATGKDSAESLKSQTDSIKSDGGKDKGKAEESMKVDGKRVSPPTSDDLDPAIRQLLDAAYAKIKAKSSDSKLVPGSAGAANKADSFKTPKPKNSSSNASRSGEKKKSQLFTASTSSKKSDFSDTKIQGSRLLTRVNPPAKDRSRSRSQVSAASDRVRSPPAPPPASDRVALEPKSPVGDTITKPMEKEDPTQFKTLPLVPVKSPVKSPVVDPMKRNIIKQFNTIEDVINSKFTGDTSKMKSIWFKTPYQPMTHERFKEYVTKYGKEEGLGQDRIRKYSPPTPPRLEYVPEKQKNAEPVEEAKPPITATNPPPSTAQKPNPGETPNPKRALPWELEERLNQLAKREPTILQLQSPPRLWIDSETTSLYNKVNMNYSEQLDQLIATRAHQRLREERLRRARLVRGQLVNQPNPANQPKNEHEIYQFYKEVIKKNANNASKPQ